MHPSTLSGTNWAFQVYGDGGIEETRGLPVSGPTFSQVSQGAHLGGSADNAGVA
jgi:hypothetical protein